MTTPGSQTSASARRDVRSAATPRRLEPPTVRASALPRFRLFTDDTGREWLVVRTGTGWLIVDPTDGPALRLLLPYVLAGSMSTEMFRHRP